jgi:hypothetical protein
MKARLEAVARKLAAVTVRWWCGRWWVKQREQAELTREAVRRSDARAARNDRIIRAAQRTLDAYAPEGAPHRIPSKGGHVRGNRPLV